MSSLYFWGKPITKGLFIQENQNIASISLEKVVEQVSSGEKHCVVVVDGEAYGFGDNSQGQLGESQLETLQEIVPISLGSFCKVKEVSCGWNHTLILDLKGNVYSSGSGECGELGRGKSGNNFTFSIVLRGARQISAGRDHSLALCGSKVMGWGNSKEGQLGLLINRHYFYPHELNVYPCDLIFAGPKYSLFVTSKGVFGSGVNSKCQLGLGH
jgi:alpha-tubulin suppressor-like RCC1 family protein